MQSPTLEMQVHLSWVMKQSSQFHIFSLTSLSNQFPFNFKAFLESGLGTHPHHSTNTEFLQKRNLLSSVTGLEHQLVLRDNSVIPKYPSHTTRQIIWKLHQGLPSMALLLPCACPASSALELPTGPTRWNWDFLIIFKSQAVVF